MPRTFDATVRHIKRELRGAIAFVGDEEDRLAGLLFEIAPDLADRLGQDSPAAQPIARVMPAPPIPKGFTIKTTSNALMSRASMTAALDQLRAPVREAARSRQ